MPAHGEAAGWLGPAEPWVVRATGLDLAEVSEMESVFALANGRVGVRGVLDEGDPAGLPGTYLNSFYEERELTYPESGYAFPERSQTVVGAPEATTVRAWIDGHRLDVRTGLLDHERVLDLRAGTLRRTLRWRAPSGGTVQVTSTRMVCLTRPAVVAVRYEVRAEDQPVTVRLESELVANPPLPDQEGETDPRSSTVLEAPLVARAHTPRAAGGVLVHSIRHSGHRVAAATTHAVNGPPGAKPRSGAEPDRVLTTVDTDLPAGGTVVVTKLTAYAWSPDSAGTELAGRAEDDLRAAVGRGWDGLAEDQRAFLDRFWAGADVELDGDPPVQQAVRFGLFHILQAATAEGALPIAAKGLTGNGYDGHAMWDTEMFVLPVLTYLWPAAARGPLRWRHATLDAARDRARELRLAGATFAWRTIGGQECSGYWPAGSAALHVNADVADAVRRYVAATGDTPFLRDFGLELLAETARMWCRAGRYDEGGGFHIDGVTGPDEYTALVNDNVYTNLMARANLFGAARAAQEHPDRAQALAITAEEVAAWRQAAEAMHIPYDDKRQVHPQCAGFTELAEWDFARTTPEEYPLLLHYPYLELYRRQVVKQADLVLATHVCGDAFTPEQKARDFAYYEPRTVRDSSLSAPSQAVIAAELGHLDLAHEYLSESALHDLHDLSDKTGDGLHIAALAGAWNVLVMGYGGLRDHHGRLTFAPRLPGALTRLRFTVRWRGRPLRVTVTPHDATYLLHGDGDPAELRLRHHGEAFTLRPGIARTLPIPAAPDPGPPPPPPPSREPSSRL